MAQNRAALGDGMNLAGLDVLVKLAIFGLIVGLLLAVVGIGLLVWKYGWMGIVLFVAAVLMLKGIIAICKESP
jgi:hypothetical protein